MIALWAYLARNPFYHWCEAREPGEVTNTHEWAEAGKPKSETVRPNPAGQTYTVTAAEGPIENRAVTIAVANDG